ncbi:MAG TPA: TetR family transcriptional regulator [Nocardioidaceae bacterium]|nr:TetR family transcriptional regulator [Nocardioidaceae bacterium]
MTSHTRGRRPAGSDTRETIILAARKRFSEHGYPGTTMRAIAADAEVDPRLITHFFGSKQELFATVVELPFNPEVVFPMLLSGSDDGLGRRLAEFILNILENPQSRNVITGIIRAAASEDAAAAQIRDRVVVRMLTPLAEHVGADRPELRASLIASQVVGLAFARHVVEVPALRSAERAELATFLGRVFDVYLRGPLPPVDG